MFDASSKAENTSGTYNMGYSIWDSYHLEVGTAIFQSLQMKKLRHKIT